MTSGGRKGETTVARRGETIVAQAGCFIDPASGAVTPPIQSSVTFARDVDYALIDPDFNYGCGNNPTTATAETLLARLEGAEAAQLFATGLAADVVFHSAAKYLNGHSGVLAGVLLSAKADDAWKRIGETRWLGGAVLGVIEAWLLTHRLRTLFLRVRRASESALAIARHFEGHEKLDAVLYPGFASHPGHTIDAKQMTGGFGGMLSLLSTGARAAAVRAALRAEIFLPSTSHGGVESLVEHRTTIEGPESDVPENLLRLSVGIDDVGELIADLEHMLSSAS